MSKFTRVAVQTASLCHIAAIVGLPAAVTARRRATAIGLATFLAITVLGCGTSTTASGDAAADPSGEVVAGDASGDSENEGDDAGGGADDAPGDTSSGDSPDASPALLHVSGKLTGRPNAQGVPNATVSIHGTSPAVSTTTDADGNWSLLVPAGQHQLVASAPGFWGEVQAFSATSDLVIPYFAVSADSEMAGLEAAGGPKLDSAKGIVVFYFQPSDNDGSVAGGESAAVAAEAGPPFCVSKVVGGIIYQAETAGASESEARLYFPNVSPGETTATVAGKLGATDCVLRYPGSMAVLPKTSTYVVVDCTKSK